MLTNATRRQIHGLCQRILQSGIIDAAGAMRIRIKRHRFSNANSVSQLDGAFFSQPGGHNIFCQITTSISRRPVDLGWVFTGKRSPTMRCGTPICVNNDFTSGQTSIAVRAANDKLTSWIDQQVICAHHPTIWHHIGNGRCYKCTDITLCGGLVMLC